MFQQIDISELCYNKKYKIVSDKTYIGIYKGKCWSDEFYLGTFIGIFYFPYEHVEYAEFVRVFNKTTCVYLDSKLFSPSCMFYRFISQKAKIQSDMEHRAVNIIISGIIGDTHFIWLKKN